MRAPLVIPALLVLDAIVVARDCSFTPVLVLALLAALALACKSRAHWVTACAIACGLVLGTYRGAPSQLDHEIEHTRLSGVVVSDVLSQPWGDSLEVRSSGRLRYALSVHEHVMPGEHVIAAGRLEPFDVPRNPGEPSSRDFARERGLSARLVDAHVVARAPPSNDIESLPARLRAYAGSSLHRFLGEPDATILAGMLYGARGALPPELRVEFQDTGTVHVLVTAGLHLGVVAALVAFVFSRAGLGRVAASLSAIPLVWMYATLSGGHVPSLRAAVMVTVALVARACGERALSLNTLAVAAIAVAAIWPAWVGGASFALSFSCVTAIVLFAEPIAAWLEHVRIPGIFREPLALTFATQLGVWPLTASTFLVIAPYAPLANLFVVPVVGVAMLGGIALIAVTPLPGLAALVARIESWPLAWIESTVHLTAHLPFAHVIATPPPAWTLAVYDLAMIAVGALVRASALRR
ncbi:MAG TPA: ComEC/Rec2 family competence protein [Candidatus Baltobacteraceae bacterium]|jgi:competence protein ComEC